MQSLEMLHNMWLNNLKQLLYVLYDVRISYWECLPLELHPVRQKSLKCLKAQQLIFSQHAYNWEYQRWNSVCLSKHLTVVSQQTHHNLHLLEQYDIQDRIPG